MRLSTSKLSHHESKNMDSKLQNDQNVSITNIPKPNGILKEKEQPVDLKLAEDLM